MHKKAFTLIELLVVVLIIAILAAVALPQYTAAVEKSRASEAWLNAKALGTSAARYILATDEFPTSFAQLDVTLAGTKIDDKTYYNNYFVYYLNPARKDVTFCRITPSKDNITTTPIAPPNTV
ncbi:prepilin-type N-terminal cleavage/methylation domain-containing protein [Parelusimicrobium proximum]|uniref:type IV pilin protein n=1 Tax=Parelusimicrobium proximum TaxID=3228953 RepID=UPI003D166750